MVINATAALVSQVAGFVQELADRVTGIGPPPTTATSAVVRLQTQLHLLADTVFYHPLSAAAASLHLDAAAVQITDFLHHQRTELTENFSNWLVVYGWTLPIIFFLWPLLLSVVLTVLSASTWTFWLLTSVFVGIVQTVYVTYTFGVIFVDLAMLSGLKTFAMIRSQIRYFTVKSGLQTKGSRRRARRRGRRREWRTKVDGARSYAEYGDIDIDEPAKQQDGAVVPEEASSRGSRVAADASNANANGNGNDQIRKNGTGGRPPKVPAMSARERMRKSQSCVNLESSERDQNTDSPTRSRSEKISSSVENGGGRGTQ